MRRQKLFIIFSIIVITLTGCEPRIKIEPQRTLLFFFPWSTNLTHYFENNVRCFEKSLSQKDLQENSVFVFISNTDSTACFYKINKNNKGIKHDTIAKFENYRYEYTSTKGLSKIFSRAKNGNNPFSLIIGCHGDAWIPAKDMKRSFGGSEIESRIDISTLRQALENNEIVAEYILFDDCYMSSVEVAYELRHVCKYLITSPTEIMAAGMPYENIAKDLINTPNYSAICNDFYTYYINNTSTPYGAIAITKCDELDSLASIVSKIEQLKITEDVQFYDGYNPHIFYDLGDYIDKVCKDENLNRLFTEQLNRCVPYKAHTPIVYTYGFGTIKIKTYSGISTSAPSENKKCDSYGETAWAKDTNWGK
jgi:hypothetical protein